MSNPQAHPVSDEKGSSNRDPLLLAHEADGIKELDNLLPRWWVWLFYLCTAFAVVYMIYYHVLRAGDLQAAQFDKEFKRGELLKSVALAKFESTLSTLEPAKDEVILAKGHQTFTTLC